MELLFILSSGRPFELQKKEEEEDDEQSFFFYRIPRFTVALYFIYSESIKVYRITHRACSLSEKA